MKRRAALVASVLVIAGCPKRASNVADGVISAQDSVWYVSAAKNAIYRDTPERDTLMVTRFLNDSAGVLIDLVPVPKKRVLMVGDGSIRVRVFKNGLAKILEVGL